MAESNVKSDATQLPKSSDHGEILKQVEFYFSDNNLPYDRFLWTETRKSDGWISLDTIRSFKRMQRFEPAEEVVAALRKSENLLEVSEDGSQVRRKTPLSAKSGPQLSKDRFARTVYAKGFGPETATSQFDIEEFFGQFGPLNQVRLRRSDDGTFKESVFAEFANLEDAQRFVEQSPAPKYLPKGTASEEAKEEAKEEPKEAAEESKDESKDEAKDESKDGLLVMSKQAYVEMKSEQHNFADRTNGRRKPKFNAYKELASAEIRNKRNQGRNNRQNRNKRRSDDYERRDESEEPASKRAKAAESEAAPVEAEEEAQPEATEA